MMPEIGVFLLVMALLLACFQAAYLLPHGGVKTVVAPVMRIAIWLQTVCISCAFIILMLLRVESDFSVENVVLHSNHSLPLLYKIAGTWGNHEGSMLLWVLVLSTFGLALACSSARERNVAVSVQAALAAGVLAFILFTSNPFARVFPPEADGRALNPILQDIALALHPPLLYVGYVGFSTVFSLAVAALITGGYGASFARAARPWALVSWTALTLGIGLGSWWAYRELGWGGFWFWDPVENASLLPWLAGTALLHSTIVLEKRGRLASWVLLLSILTFGLSLLGTFLVRSGALVSVHSFASDPARGLFILLYMAVTVGAALLLFAVRAPRREQDEPMMLASREGMIIFNNLFLLSACAIVLLGTVYPLFAEWISGQSLTVGAPYFNAIFVPLMALPIVLAGLTVWMPWQQAKMLRAAHKSMPSLLAALAGILLAAAWISPVSVYVLLGTGLSIWLLGSSIQWFFSVRNTAPRAYAIGVLLAHGGVAVFIAGATGTGALQQERQQSVAIGDAITLAGYTVTYTDETRSRTANYDARHATLYVSHNDLRVATLSPEYRLYDIRRVATSEAAIYSSILGDLYAVIGETDGGKTALRLYYNPLASFLWLGGLMMVAGGSCAFYHARRNRRSLL